MLTSTDQQNKPKRGRPRTRSIKICKPRLIRFPGIVADARELGVDRVTLYRVLTGEFSHLRGLRERYEILKISQKQLPPAPTKVQPRKGAK